MNFLHGILVICFTIVFFALSSIMLALSYFASKKSFDFWVSILELLHLKKKK